jgi:pimeloyl-ACP methyl ester carboxylesterase
VPMRPNKPWRHPFGVPRIEKPCAEGLFHLPGGRRLGYAEYGDPSGPVALWFHGTPGRRRQFPLLGRRAAEKLGLRVVLVERPGSGAVSRPSSTTCACSGGTGASGWPT